MPKTRLESLFWNEELNAGHGRILRELLRPDPDWRKSVEPRIIRQFVIHAEEKREDYQKPLEDRPWGIFNEYGDRKLHVSTQEAEPLLTKGIVRLRRDEKNALELSDDWKDEVKYHFSIDRLVEHGLIDAGHLRVLKLLLSPTSEWPKTIRVYVREKTRDHNLENRVTESSGIDYNLHDLFVTRDELNPLFREGIISKPPDRGLQVHPSWTPIVTDFLQRQIDEEYMRRQEKWQPKLKSKPPEKEQLLRERYPREVDTTLANAFKQHFEELLTFVELRDVRGVKKWQFNPWMKEKEINDLREYLSESSGFLKKLFRDSYALFHADNPGILASNPALARLPRAQFDQVMKDSQEIRKLLEDHGIQI